MRIVKPMFTTYTKKIFSNFNSSRRFLSTTDSVTVLSSEPSLLLKQYGNVQSIILNRPKALNSLNLEMCVKMRDILLKWKNNTSNDVGAFVMKGAGGKSFCAGGDVKSVWTDIISGDSNIGTGKPGLLSSDFFRTEYQMNYLLGTSNIPQVSLWDGIVMGGGVGISVLGDFRVATEKTVFAMPETGIGLFPDVGSSAWLPHLTNGFGKYIGLTGCRLAAADLLYSGIATHYIPSVQLSDLEEAIIKSCTSDASKSRKAIKNLLKQYCSDHIPDSSNEVLKTNEEAIIKCFGNPTSVEGIIENLNEEISKGNVWAESTLQVLLKVSPTSLKLAFAQINAGKTFDLKSCLEMEYRLVSRCMKAPDFKEGVRALLVDKDNKPQWSPKTLEEVAPEVIDKYFESLGEYDLQLNFD